MYVYVLELGNGASNRLGLWVLALSRRISGSNYELQFSGAVLLYCTRLTCKRCGARNIISSREWERWPALQARLTYSFASKLQTSLQTRHTLLHLICMWLGLDVDGDWNGHGNWKGNGNVRNENGNGNGNGGNGNGSGNGNRNGNG